MYGSKRQDFNRQARLSTPNTNRIKSYKTKQEWLVKQELWAKSQADKRVFEQATLKQMFFAAPFDAANIPYFRFLKGANALISNAAVTGGVISTSEVLRLLYLIMTLERARLILLLLPL